MSDFEDSTLASIHRPGRVLHDERTRRKLELEAVARQLRLSLTQVRALEADDYEKLPGTTFVRGFIRNYARILEIDAEPLLARFELMQPPPASRVLSLNAPKGEVGSSTTRLFPGPKRRLRRARMRLALGAVALVAVVAVASGVATRWFEPGARFARTSPTAPSSVPSAQAFSQAQAQTPAPMAQAPSAGPPSAGKRGRLELKTQRQSWIEVRDAERRRVLAELLPGGTAQAVEGDPPLALTVGDASAVAITYNGQDIDLAPFTRDNVARLTLK